MPIEDASHFLARHVPGGQARVPVERLTLHERQLKQNILRPRTELVPYFGDEFGELFAESAMD